MLTCLIVEDDYAFGLSVKIQVQELGLKVLGIVSNIKAIKDMVENNHIDLILSDMKLEHGEYAYEFFNANNINIPLILFSGYSSEELYQKSQTANPYIYLTKPFDKLTLRSAVEGALRDKMQAAEKGGDIESNEGSIFIRNQGKLVSISPHDLRYVQSEGNHCFLFLNNKKVAIRSSLKNILEKVNSQSFIQVHRAYLVNYNFVKQVDIAENRVFVDGNSIPIGRKYKKDFIQGMK